MINFYNLCLNYSSVNISHFQCKSIGKFWRVSYSLMEQKIAVMDVSTDFFFSSENINETILCNEL